MARFGLVAAATLTTGTALLPTAAGADQVPPEFRGTWGERCADPAASRITLEADKVIIATGAQHHTFSGVTASHTWVGGARSTGKQVVLPISKEPNGPYSFVLEPPPYGKKGAILVDEAHPDHGREVKHLFRKKFFRCASSAVAEVKQPTLLQGGGDWIARATPSPPGMNLNGKATIGKVTLSGSCRKAYGPGFMGSLYSYPGKALKRIDDRDEPVTFEVVGGNSPTSFAMRMVYYAPEKAWVMTDQFPASFLDALEQGKTLTIRNFKGEDVVTFSLDGAARVIQVMRQGCTV